jgi:ELWxxDGT repeat protein
VILKYDRIAAQLGAAIVLIYKRQAAFFVWFVDCILQKTLFMRRLLFTLVCLVAACSSYAQPWAQLVKDACAGACNTETFYHYTLNNKIYFRGSDAVNGHELWTSDGTGAGTTMVKDLTPAIGESTDLGPFTECNNKLYFNGRLPGATGSLSNVYVTDGTANGSFSFTDAENYGLFVPFNNEMYFIGWSPNQSSLFKTDGTISGTLPLHSNANAGPAKIDYSVVFNGKLFLGLQLGSEQGLFATDGTQTGTEMIFNAGLVSSIRILNNKMYFFARPTPSVTKLYESDGTLTGTHELLQKDLLFSDLYVYGNKLYFIGADINGTIDIWVSDGTLQGTNAIGQAVCNNINYLYYVNNKVIVTCGNKMIVTDGTIQGTFDIPMKADVANISIVNNNKLYGAMPYRFGYRLFVTDGTLTGTHYLDTTVVAKGHFTSQQMFVAFNNKIYFEGIDVIQGPQRPMPGKHSLHYIDENEKTYPVYPAITTNETQFDYTILNNSLYLAANDSASGIELWKITDFPTGVAALNNKTQHSNIYPNPATNTFSIKNDNTNNTTVKVFSLTGQLLLETKQIQNIDIAQLPAGIYMVQIAADGKTQIQKLVKE